MADFGLSFFSMVLAGLLVPIAWIDFRHHRIPNALSLGLLAGGVAFHVLLGTGLLLVQILFGLTVFVFFLIIRKAHSAVTGIVGLGMGDVKMAGAGAIWFSPVSFPVFLFTASVSALGLFAVMSAVGHTSGWRQRVPFGPFLALGIVVAYGTENVR